MIGSTELVFVLLAAFISMVTKRLSARRGGILYKYNQGLVRKHFSDRRRRIRDMLSDPLLARYVERRYGDVSSLRDWVERWEESDFAPRENEDGDNFIKIGGEIVFPWIRVMNTWLSVFSFFMLCGSLYGLSIPEGLYFTYTPWPNMIMLMSLMHIADNMLLQRSQRGIIAAVGVPVLDVEGEMPFGEVNGSQHLLTPIQY